MWHCGLRIWTSGERPGIAVCNSKNECCTVECSQGPLREQRPCSFTERMLHCVLLLGTSERGRITVLNSNRACCTNRGRHINLGVNACFAMSACELSNAHCTLYLCISLVWCGFRMCFRTVWTSQCTSGRSKKLGTKSKGFKNYNCK